MGGDHHQQYSTSTASNLEGGGKGRGLQRRISCSRSTSSPMVKAGGAQLLGLQVHTCSPFPYLLSFVVLLTKMDVPSRIKQEREELQTEVGKLLAAGAQEGTDNTSGGGHHHRVTCIMGQQVMFSIIIDQYIYNSYCFACVYVYALIHIYM